MKRLIVVALILASLPSGARAEEKKFTASVTPEDLAAAGIAGLSPAQTARLNALVEAYKSGALATARRMADEALAAKQFAEAQTVRAEAKAEAARMAAAKAEAAQAEAVKTSPAPAQSGPAAGFLAKAKVLLMPGTKVEEVTIESSIPGKFHGWEPHQVFTLANGQRWQVANKDNYYTRAIENPKVQIVPAAMAGYWLRFPDLDTQVRVNFIGEK